MNNKLLEKLKRIEKEHLKYSREYEQKKSFEMSYIALWTVLEHIMKPIASIGMKNKLNHSLREWIDHLENPKAGKQPKEINNFKTEYNSTSIPPISLIEEAIGDVPKLKVLMDSNGKYRKKRNNIAHRAEKMSEKTYNRYKAEVLFAIDELKQTLGNINVST